MDAELGRRALESLEDAEDAREAAEILARIESGQERTYTMAEVAAELGITLG
jgi:predicted DNA-binding protein